jgi:hypothetical protein
MWGKFMNANCGWKFAQCGIGINHRAAAVNKDSIENSDGILQQSKQAAWQGQSFNGRPKYFRGVKVLRFSRKASSLKISDESVWSTLIYILICYWDGPRDALFSLYHLILIDYTLLPLSTYFSYFSQPKIAHFVLS